MTAFWICLQLFSPRLVSPRPRYISSPWNVTPMENILKQNHSFVKCLLSNYYPVHFMSNLFLVLLWKVDLCPLGELFHPFIAFSVLGIIWQAWKIFQHIFFFVFGYDFITKDLHTLYPFPYFHSMSLSQTSMPAVFQSCFLQSSYQPIHQDICYHPRVQDSFLEISFLEKEQRFLSWRRKWQPTPEFLLGKFHGHSSLVGWSP